MNSTEIKTLATKMFNSIKKSLADARKYNKDNGHLLGGNAWGRRQQVVDIEVWDNDVWEGGKRTTKSYTIKIDGKEIGKCTYRSDVDCVFSELGNQLKAQKKVKGWGGLNYASERVGDWNSYQITIIPKVCLADAVCKEYTSLQNYINKYGSNRQYLNKMNLGNYELFSSAMGGKRGRLWDEYGERFFLDNKPKKCARLLEELRKNRGTKDAMICERGEEDYIDPEEQRYSAYAEIECEGEKRKYLLITIKTPTGKVKYETKIY
jgi:hypothetical protein